MNIDFNNLKMLGSWTLLEKDKGKTHKLIHVPDSFVKASPMGRVLKTGANVPSVVVPGDYVFVGAFNKWKRAHSLTDSKTGVEAYICPWYDIYGRIFDGRLIPIGRKILVKRVFEEKLSNVIFSRDYNRENVQSLEVEIVRIGIDLPGDRFRKIKDLKTGDRCKLQRWEHHMVEVGINNEYHLIIHENDIEYKYDN